MTDFERELRFLLDRLEEYDPEDEDHVRDWYGHVHPSLSRMQKLFAAGGRWCESGNVLIPHSDDEARAMNLVSENYLKTHQ